MNFVNDLAKIFFSKIYNWHFITDGYIGLYKTILSLSILYLTGETVLTLTSLKPLGAPNVIGPAIGLISKYLPNYYLLNSF